MAQRPPLKAPAAPDRRSPWTCLLSTLRISGSGDSGLLCPAPLVGLVRAARQGPLPLLAGDSAARAGRPCTHSAAHGPWGGVCFWLLRVTPLLTGAWKCSCDRSLAGVCRLRSEGPCAVGGPGGPRSQPRRPLSAPAAAQAAGPPGCSPVPVTTRAVASAVPRSLRRLLAFGVFSRAYWLLLYLTWRTIYSDPPPIFMGLSF